MLSGDPGCGKSAVLKTVLRCMSKTGLAKLPPYVDIDDSMWFRSATMIFRSVMQWWTHHQKLKAKKGEKIVSDEVDHIHTTTNDVVDVSSHVIYTASLSSQNLIGDFNSKGHWQDGLFPRKIRMMGQAKESNGKRPAIKIIILVGAMGSSIEPMFSHHYFRTSTVKPPGNEGCASNSRLVLPSTEILSIPEGVQVVFETCDTSAASPSLITTIPCIRVSVDMEFCVNRLLVAWVRSLSGCLAKFPPWVAILDDIKNLFFRQKFVTELIDIGRLLKQDMHVLINSMISTFLRITEDLLIECHGIALQECTWLSDADLDDSSDEEEDASNDDGNRKQLTIHLQLQLVH